MILSYTVLYAQGCESEITINLKNIRGGIYAGETVVFSSDTEGKFTQISDANGKVKFTLPCDTKFKVTISNYTREVEMRSPEHSGGWAVRNFSYEPDMKEKEHAFAMEESDKAKVDISANRLPDTTFVKGTMMKKPMDFYNYSILSVRLMDLKKGPLTNEEVTMIGTKRNKAFKGRTNSTGRITFYLPKGDKYSLNFKHHPEYAFHEIRYSRGTSTARMELMYIGTPEIERRMEEDRMRMLEEEERLKKEHEEFLAWCEKEGITEEEGHRRRLMESTKNMKDTVIAAVLNRQPWSEKLIVTDLTGSMTPYANQLSLWYQLNYKNEDNLQFVFFNDGDGKSDSEKVIGSTGGIYYQKAKGIDSLIMIMGKVRSRGGGGDGPENNMEALIKGTKMANPFKELVMVVDNNAPVKDIELLKDFHLPVRIILCGATAGYIREDYLNIALKTGGSVHTIEEDITRIAGMSEGQTLTIKGITYKIMGGLFIRTSDT